MAMLALTGATGFVGRITLEKLLAAGHQVRALTRRDQPARGGVVWINGALDNAASLAELCTGAQTVLHIAGVVNAPDWAGFKAGNIDGTAQILAAAERAGAARFIHVSSLSARSPELSLYGKSKRDGEDLVRSQTALAWVAVRPPGVYGPGDTEMLDMYRSAAKGVLPMPPRGRVSLIHVEDLARLLVALAGNGSADGTLLEPDDGHPGGWSHLEFGQMIGAAVGKSPLILHMPRWAMMAAATADHLFRGNAAKLTRDRVSYLAHDDWVASDDKRPDPALWTPLTDTAGGLAETAAWYRAQGWI